MSETRIVTWSSPEKKSRWLDAAAAADALHPEVRALARQLETTAGRDPLRFTLAVHGYCRDAIRYRRDPGGREQFADAPTIIRRGFDDCDGKARLFVALIRAAKIPGLIARIVPVHDKPTGQRFIHVQAEARFPGSEAHPLADPEGWILAEMTLEGVRLGEGGEAARIDPHTGKPRLA